MYKTMTFLKFKEYVELINLYTTTLNSVNFARKQKLIDETKYNILRYALAEYINLLVEEIEQDLKATAKKYGEMLGQKP